MARRGYRDARNTFRSFRGVRTYRVDGAVVPALAGTTAPSTMFPVGAFGGTNGVIWDRTGVVSRHAANSGCFRMSTHRFDPQPARQVERTRAARQARTAPG